VTDERGLFERTTREAFQSGLSWLTILRKRTRPGTLLL
jgi:DNA-3-methyladenine glycosylase I